MTFLVLAQGHLIVIGPLPLSYGGLFGIGLVVGSTTGIVSYLFEPRLATKGRV
jgi:hypothetical protein